MKRSLNRRIGLLRKAALSAPSPRSQKSLPNLAQFEAMLAGALLQWGGGQYPYALITNGATYIGNSSVVPGTLWAHAGTR
jgi:hypothetical protein